MNPIRERILIGIKPYTDFAKHKSLVAFCVSSECFEDWDETEENNGIPLADFSELTVIVERKWLFQKMKSNGIKNPKKYLKEEYTSDDSYEWFMDAKEEGKIILVGF